MKQENIFVKLKQYITNSLRENSEDCLRKGIMELRGFLDKDNKDFLKRDIYINFMNVACATEAEIWCGGEETFNSLINEWEKADAITNKCYVIYFSNNSQPICVTKDSLDAVMEETDCLE